MEVDKEKAVERIKRGDYSYASDTLSEMSQKEIMDLALDEPQVVRHTELKYNEEFMLSLVRQGGNIALRYSPLNKNPEFMLMAIKANMNSLVEASEELLQNPEFMKSVLIENNGIEKRIGIATRFMQNSENKAVVDDVYAGRMEKKAEELHKLMEESKAKKGEIKELEEEMKEIRDERANKNKDDEETR